jgi:hypothetical protein
MGRVNLNPSESGPKACPAIQKNFTIFPAHEEQEWGPEIGADQSGKQASRRRGG